MAKNECPDIIPDGMRWDRCTKRLKKIDRHKVVVVETGWPEAHVSSIRCR